jgi:hypothetical protein
MTVPGRCLYCCRETSLGPGDLAYVGLLFPLLFLIRFERVRSVSPNRCQACNAICRYVLFILRNAAVILSVRLVLGLEGVSGGALLGAFIN